MAVQDVANGATSGERTERAATDRRWPVEPAPARRATVATPVERLATADGQMVGGADWNCPDGQLVSQSKFFEQEVSMHRQRESDRSEGPNDVLHHV